LGLHKVAQCGFSRFSPAGKYRKRIDSSSLEFSRESIFKFNVAGMVIVVVVDDRDGWPAALNLSIKATGVGIDSAAFVNESGRHDSNRVGLVLHIEVRQQI